MEIKKDQECFESLLNNYLLKSNDEIFDCDASFILFF
jgi:hypothetical protein